MTDIPNRDRERRDADVDPNGDVRNDVRAERGADGSRADGSPGEVRGDRPGVRDARTTERAGTADPQASGDSERTHVPLFPAEDTDRFRSRWMDIQTQFVDEPRRAVEQADDLVTEITDRIMKVFTHNREDLERQWTAGDEVSTEDLRRTLRSYRSFFERLLSF